MTTNVGTVDRIARLIIGGALLAFAIGIIAPGSGYNWIGWLGFVLILSAVFATCPLYSLIGMRTCAAAAH